MTLGPRCGKHIRFSLCAFCILLPAFPFAQQAKQRKAAGADPYHANSNHAGPVWFVDVAKDAGLTMQNVNGEADTKKYIIETTGSGVAIIDYDRDGWPDIFLVNGKTLPGAKSEEIPTSHLFHNNHDGTFTDVTV